MDYVTYVITNTKNGLKYIGSTGSYHNRKAFHKKALKRGTHFNCNLQSDWDKQNGKGFKVKALARFSNRKDAYSYESELINTLKPYKIYNILRGQIGGDVLTFNPNRDAVIKKHRKNGLKIPQTEIIRRFSKPGEKNPNWKGGKSVVKCSCGNRMSYTANVCHDCRDRTGKNNPFYGKKHSKKTIKKLSEASKGVIPTNARAIKINGVKYISMNEASRELGIPVPTILWRANSLNKKFTGYRFINA